MINVISKHVLLKSNSNSIDYHSPHQGEKTCAYVTLQGTFSRILLIFHYIVVTKYYFFNLQSMGDENVINAPVELLEEGESSDKDTM